jgi:lipoprotein-anchoring transpeptidase ErfK/SrfK
MFAQGMAKARLLSQFACLGAALVGSPLPSQAQASSNGLSLAARLQAALDREGFGVGLIDGREGPRTRGALLDYCRARNLTEIEARGRLLQAGGPRLQKYRITESDLGKVGRAPSDWLEASEVPAMDYTSLDEALSETFRMSKALIASLNPDLSDWSAVRAGQSIVVLAPVPARERAPAARLEIDCSAYRLRAMDSSGRLIASYPCSVAREFQKIPAGELRVVAFAPNPNYTFDPDNFPESARAREIGRRLILPPGPNNPVGIYWLSLSLPGFGLHGTPHPETIGRAESRGCFRLTNWDIANLAGRVSPGVLLIVRVPAQAPAGAHPPGADAPPERPPATTRKAAPLPGPGRSGTVRPGNPPD